MGSSSKPEKPPPIAPPQAAPTAADAAVGSAQMLEDQRRLRGGFLGSFRAQQPGAATGGGTSFLGGS